MTQLKTKNLKTQMCHEFSKIFELCNEVLEKAHQPSLIKATLETLLKFLNWIPLGYIFETNIIDNLWARVIYIYIFGDIYFFLIFVHIKYFFYNTFKFFLSFFFFFFFSFVSLLNFIL